MSIVYSHSYFGKAWHSQAVAGCSLPDAWRPAVMTFTGIPRDFAPADR